jgi:hypothetical protein
MGAAHVTLTDLLAPLPCRRQWSLTSNKVKLRRPIRMWIAGSIIAFSGFVLWIMKEVLGGFFQGILQGFFKRS